MKKEFKNEDIFCYVRNAYLKDEKEESKFKPLVLDARCQLGKIDLIFWKPEKLNIEKNDKETWPAKSGDFLKVSIKDYERAKSEYEKKNYISLQGEYNSNFTFKVINQEDVPDDILGSIYKDRTKQIDTAKNSLKDDSYWNNKELGKFLREIICENPEFIKYPAAVRNHHAYEGGLLVHSYEVKHICSKNVDSAEELYPGSVDTDVLYLSAWLHDIGKIQVYSLDKNGDPVLDSEKEKRINHIMRGFSIFMQYAKKHNLNDEFIEKVAHCILSHQDRIEWNSPVEPVDMEAVILAKADKISSDLAKND